MGTVCVRHLGVVPAEPPGEEGQHPLLPGQQGLERGGSIAVRLIVEDGAQMGVYPHVVTVGGGGEHHPQH